MVDPFGLLQSLSQIAVAFAGFGSIASALAPQKTSDITRVEAGRLLNMLSATLPTAILGMTPSALALFDLPARGVWGISAAIALAVFAFSMPRSLGRTFHMMRTKAFNWFSGITNLAMLAATVTLFLLCLLGIPSSDPAASYVAGILLLLTMSAILFFRVAYSILRTHAPEPPAMAPGDPPDGREP